MPGEPGGCEDERVPVGGSVHGVSPPTQLRYVASLRAPLPSPRGGGKARAEAAVGSFSRVRGKVARASATEGGGRLRRCVGPPLHHADAWSPPFEQSSHGLLTPASAGAGSKIAPLERFCLRHGS